MAGILMTSAEPWSCIAQNSKYSGKPNLIFILTDDQRWDTMGCMGNSIVQTPHMDRLSAQGVTFENNFVTTSICASSRASIFTGQYMRRHGIVGFSEGFSPSALSQTYPLLMRAAGYRTGFIGKWGVGESLPEKEFDYYKGFGGQGKYFHEEDGKQVHLTSTIVRQAVDFLRGCPKDQPFCLSLSFKAPHVQDEDPRQFLYDPAYETLYKKITFPVPKTAAPKYFEALPDYIRSSEARRRWEMRFSTPEKFQESIKGYYRLISGVDVMLGKIREALKELEFDDNTIIILTGDNGFYLGEHGLAGKWFMHEESIRTPLIIYDSGLPARFRGKRRKEMTLNIDLAPTMLDLAGLEIPASIQGRSLQPLIYGNSVPWRDDFFYEHLFQHARIPRTEGVRTERWKYIRYIDREPADEELYDLENDPLEIKNIALSEDRMRILDSLRQRWAFLRESLR